ncbi:MAG TPA: hypothetical protein VL086_15720 [Candidatus Nitrosotalea sp.]|nr:hypothetical protein [Candidatus Nitrosotalea sp.]
MKPGRVLLVGMLLILSSALPTLAHASPPDPSWIPGVYDGADFDDVVTVIVMGAGSTLPDAAIELRSVPRWVEAPTVPEAALDIASAAPDHSRAPPAS